MRWKIFLICMGMLVLGGCDTSMMYSRSTPQMPVRWPDDVHTCAINTTALTSLHIVVTWTQFPFIPYFRGGCGFVLGQHPIEIMKNYIGVGSAMKMDNGSHYRTYQVRYNFMLGKNKWFNQGMYYDPHWLQSLNGTKYDPAHWRFNMPVGKARMVVINGLKWKHYMFYGFESLSRYPKDPALPVSISDRFYSKQFPPPVLKVGHPKALVWVGEVYAHKVNANYKMLVWAQYDRAVVQDAHWLKVRRALLRKLVNAVTITPLTPQRLNKLKARHEAQKRAETEKEKASNNR